VNYKTLPATMAYVQDIWPFRSCHYHVGVYIRKKARP